MELGLTWEILKCMDRTALKKIIRDYDNDCQHKGLNDKPALRFYATEKKTIKYDFCYRNTVRPESISKSIIFN